MNRKTALVGNPNSGKTTLFNRLTGGVEYTGNRAGVTVGVKNGKIKSTDIRLCDLPGIYSLKGYSKEEKIAVSFIFNEKPDVIINVLDGTNLSRGLYLTLQLLKLNLPVVMVINMKDECEKENIRIDVKGISEELGVKVLFVSSKNCEGIEKVIESVCFEKGMNISCYDRLMRKLSDIEKRFDYCDKEIVSANAMYRYADELCEKYVSKEREFRESTKIADKFILNKYLAFPIMFFVILFGFFVTFGPFGKWLCNLFLGCVDFLFLTPFYRVSSLFGETFHKFITEGVLAGVESVAGFLPYVFILFFYTAILEECGYMSRIVFISDRLMKRAGLSGKAVVPFVLGFGCNTPAIMSARIIRCDSERDRTICLVPFMNCSAKIPVAALLCSMFFKEKYLLVLLFLYLFGILSAVIFAFAKPLKKCESEGFVLELPPYRIPDLKSVFPSVIKKIREFLLRVGTTVVILGVVMRFLSGYNFSFENVPVEKSILGILGCKLAPLFSPLGFGSYRAAVSLVSGVAAKEGIAATLSILCGGYENIKNFFTPASSVSFLTFVFLYLPCFSSFVTLFKELKCRKRIFLSLFFHTVYAYAATFLVYRIALLILP